MQDALSKVNRMITGAPIYIRTTDIEVCPHCKKAKVKHEYTKYTWKPLQFENSRSYAKLLGKLTIENGCEILDCKPNISEWYCKDCREFDTEDDLPF